MLTLRKNQHGFSLIELFIVLVVIGVLVVTGLYVFGKNRPGNSESSDRAGSTTSSDAVQWQFDENKQAYVASGTPPECPSPLFAKSPVDTTLATSVLYPGQYRGMNYKTHGGFAFDNSKASDVQVVIPMEGELTGLVRYIEAGEIQYKVDFVNSCGISFYFDHLYTLSPAVMAVAETTPEPKVDDTRSTPLTSSITLKTGDVIATAAGHPKSNNISMDFGVLDLRKPNEISKNTKWKALHKQFSASEWYGICWFDQLPAADTARAKSLPSRDQKSGTRSDYCPNDMGNTLDVNNGKPI